jgi:hypothetical protein
VAAATALRERERKRETDNERERETERESDLSYNMTCSGKAKLWSIQPRDPPLCWDCS